MDELRSSGKAVPQTGGVVSWGEGHNPGVYFIVADIDGIHQTEKVILVK